jgi:hypothetical protein
MPIYNITKKGFDDHFLTPTHTHSRLQLALLGLHATIVAPAPTYQYGGNKHLKLQGPRKTIVFHMFSTG